MVMMLLLKQTKWNHSVCTPLERVMGCNTPKHNLSTRLRVLNGPSNVMYLLVYVVRVPLCGMPCPCHF